MKYNAHIGRRMLAGIIDYTFVFLVTFIIIFALGEPNVDNELSLNGLPALLPILFWGLYTIGIEQKYGSTIGNNLVGLKPISLLDTEELTLGQSVKRHLLDSVDMFCLGFVTIIIIVYSSKKQRLGDMWAETIVVSVP